MNTFELIVTIILVVAYTVFSVFAVTKFKRLLTGFAGSLCLAAGGVGVYLSGVFVAAAVLWLLKALLTIGLIALIVSIFAS